MDSKKIDNLCKKAEEEAKKLSDFIHANAKQMTKDERENWVKKLKTIKDECTLD